MWQTSYKDIDINDAGSSNTCYRTACTHNPSSQVIAELQRDAHYIVQRRRLRAPFEQGLEYACNTTRMCTGRYLCGDDVTNEKIEASLLAKLRGEQEE